MLSLSLSLSGVLNILRRKTRSEEIINYARFSRIRNDLNVYIENVVIYIIRIISRVDEYLSR